MPTTTRAILCLFTLVVLSAITTRAADDLLLADFESPTYPPGWTVTGTAFGTAPAHGALPNQQQVSGFQGKGLVNSYLNGDRSTGTLTSPPFTLDRNYLTFLIGGGDHPNHTCVNLLVENKIVATATGQDDEHLDGHTWDLRPLRGKQGALQIVDDEKGGWGHVNVDHILLTDKPAVPPESPENAALLYTESLRPQFHFTAAKNWINDPNGLVFYAGEYHLFFQHNPSGIKWGNMTWGHAVSPDLVHWTQLPNALTPDDLGTMYSGSAVVDWKNTSGFGTNGQPPLVAMYTAAGGETPGSKGKPFTQCIAYSTDKGRTWTKFTANPVIGPVGKGTRDPKVIWHEPTQRWIVVLYKADGTSTFSLYNSPDLKTWTHLHDLDLKGSTECPDLFPLPLDKDPARTKWVLTAANGRYLVGSFDGQTFTPEQPPQKVDFGHNYYAVQTYSDTPDNRRIQIAWMNNGRWPRMPFNGQMSFPTELTLHTTPDGPRLFRYPIREIETLHAKEHRLTDTPINPDKPLPLPTTADLLDIETDIDLGTATEVTLTIRGQQITYSTKDQSLTALGKAPLKLTDNRLHLRILVDRTSLETFADGGRASLTSCYLPKPTDNPTTTLSTTGGPAQIRSLTVHELTSSWPQAKVP